jgi:acyl carrier protein
MAIEDEFELDIQDQEVSKVKKVQDVLDYIENTCNND